MIKRQVILIGLAYAVIVTLLGAIVFGVTYKQKLDQLAETGKVRIEQSRDRLIGQLSGFRQLTNLLTKDPRILPLLEKAPDQETNDFLLNTALGVGAEDILILDQNATVIAGAVFEDNDTSIGTNLSDQPHVKAAFSGALGFFHSLDNGARTFMFARAILDQNGSPAGAVVIQANIPALEFEWRIDEEVIAFFDENQVAFVTNRPSLEMRRLGPVSRRLKNNVPYRKEATFPMPSYDSASHFDHLIWTFDAEEDLPKTALIVSYPVPQIQLLARVFMDVGPARRSAIIQSMMVSMVLAIIGLFLLVLRQRRQNLADRLAIEEAANVRLEERVEKRTEQLRRAQHQLIEAGKLTALGQMSASISHELNQPLAAMQNFAENGAKFIELDRKDNARENFGLISGQIDRMTRIIKSLRAFARKEKEAVEPIDLSIVLSDAINLSDARCLEEGVKINVSKMLGDTMVMGGHIRLQQVIINLFTNSIDAMAGSKTKKIFVTIMPSTDTVTLCVRDTGPGLENPSRVFEPFYSTKEIGASKGLGLGLSISHGIIGTFGGELTCSNHPEGGAEFMIVLPRSQPERPS